MKTTDNYKSIAWIYDYLSKGIFFNQLEKAQTAYIKDIPKNATVLIIGGGTGYFLHQLLLQTNDIKIVYVDASSEMIRKTKQRVKKLDLKAIQRVEFICGTEKAIPSSYSFDCVCTHFFLDVFQQKEMEKVMADLTNLCKPNALWLFADFQNTNSIIQKVLLKVMFLFFKITTNLTASHLPDFYKSFQHLGWNEIKSHHFYKRMIRSSLFQKHS